MRTLRRTARMRSAKIALPILALIALLTVFGDNLAPRDPLAQKPENMLQGPSADHLLGTDYLGRDVLSRLLAGTTDSIVGILEAVGTAMLIGVVPGIASLWLGRTLSWVSLRAVEALMTLPYTLFVISVIGIFGNGLHQAMLALGVLLAPLFFRITRAAALGLMQAQYVQAAELMGASRRWILRTHLWSKVLPTVAVTTAQALAAALLAVTSFTFLGIGVQPPAPTWGGMLAADLGYLAQQPWAPVIPATMIVLTVGALNLLADAIRDGGAARDDTAPGPAPAPTPDPRKEERRAAVTV
ncbi:ABC transporter permease [Yinghuangia sp. ASG 101]|uniref:ABC transporter permease n=1 Tax=Yinghuangia sp. ASG 101 TaxID=2896848 RepID=UPI001E5F7C9B|nr:ABC transporter permease [Yinghuangia sp. ASG 101]UGQ12133.1 ABC transporter permease [Yinghuangia sp. ASG 101]